MLCLFLICIVRIKKTKLCEIGFLAKFRQTFSIYCSHPCMRPRTCTNGEVSESVSCMRFEACVSTHLRDATYPCVLSRSAGRRAHFRIAILPVDVRGGSGCLGNQLALKCGAAPKPRPLYKYPHGFDVNTRQEENMMPLCKSTRVLCS